MLRRCISNKWKIRKAIPCAMRTCRERRIGDVGGSVQYSLDLRHEVRFGGQFHARPPWPVQEYQGHSGTQFDAPQSAKRGSTEEKFSLNPGRPIRIARRGTA